MAGVPGHRRNYWVIIPTRTIVGDFPLEFFVSPAEELINRPQLESCRRGRSREPAEVAWVSCLAVLSPGRYWRLQGGVGLGDKKNSAEDLILIKCVLISVEVAEQ